MIRRAKAEDATAILAILQQIFTEMALPTFRQLSPATLQRLLLLGIKTPGYRYSYERMFVTTQGEKITGIMAGYPASVESEIDYPLKEYYPQFGLSEDFQLFTDQEAGSGEWYLDSLAVDPQFQGAGIGGSLLDFIIANPQLREHKKISLNVDKANPDAKRLYIKKGFKCQSQMTIGTHVYDHLIYLD